MFARRTMIFLDKHHKRKIWNLLERGDGRQLADEGASRKINDSTSESCGSTDAARTETVRAISGHYATTGRGTMTHDSQPARRIAFRKWVYYAPRRIRSKLQRSAHVCPAASFRNWPPRHVRSRLNANRALSPPPIMAGSWWKLGLPRFRTGVKSVLTTRILLLLLLLLAWMDTRWPFCKRLEFEQSRK